MEALGRFSRVTDQALSQSRENFDTNLQLLQRPAKQFARGAPYLIDSLKLVLTAPYPIDNVPKVIRATTSTPRRRSTSR